jgi:hypothetical protein
MLTVIILSVLMLNVVMPSVIYAKFENNPTMLTVVLLTVLMLNVIMQNAVLLNVVEPVRRKINLELIFIDEKRNSRLFLLNQLQAISQLG